jgi:hypothetical protein
MHDVTELARGQLNDGHELIIQLLRTEEIPATERTLKPAAVRILWPPQPTIINSQVFPDMAAVIVKLFAEAAIALSQIKARRYL